MCTWLEDEAILINVRRPADVLANFRYNGGADIRTALDVKVINGLGQDHFDASLVSGVAAAEAYREKQRDHLDTAALCSQQGIIYEPLVFTAQGGLERHAEALLSRIADAVSSQEEATAMEVKAELLQRISLSLARSAAKAISRRKPPRTTTSSATVRAAAEIGLMDVEA